MATKLTAGPFDGYVDEYPDCCPRCGAHIQALPRYAFATLVPRYWLQVAFVCPNTKCVKLFIAEYSNPLYEGKLQVHHLMGVLPYDKKAREFPDIIENISADFCSIYNEAYAAEQGDLKQICGGGYRKALEFLIKDYLIYLTPKDRKEIENKPLGSCIDDDIKSDNIKAVAKRATWLGNDEAHYVRRWKEKDLEDLKRFIDTTLYWIDQEELTKQSLESMPEGGATKQKKS